MGASIFSAFSDSSVFRAEFDITGYVGKNGSGKTLTAINDLLPTLKGIRWHCDDETHWHTKVGITSGFRNVLSNAPLLNPETRDPHALWVPYSEHSAFLVAEHSDVLLDEITAIFPSRGYAGLPPDVQIILNQLRKPDLKVRWTAPSWDRCDKILREVTDQIVSIKRFAPKKMPGRLRSTFSRFLIRSYDVEDWNRWVAMNRMTKIKAISYEFYHRRDDLRKGYQSQHYYNSFSQAIVPLAETQGGTCISCGGQRTKRTACTCTPVTRNQDMLEAARKYWANQLDPETGELKEDSAIESAESSFWTAATDR